MAKHTVYILLTRSGTWFSRLIHRLTQDSYTHASIGLSGPAGPFYSFARKYEHLALPAGLVEERVTPRRWNIPCCLYQLEVEDAVFYALQRRLEGMYQHRSEYHYNLLGTLGCYFHRPLSRRHHYFCSQFVAALLEESGAVELPKPSPLLRPADLAGLDGLRSIHQGDLEGILAQAAG